MFVSLSVTHKLCDLLFENSGALNDCWGISVRWTTLIHFTTCCIGPQVCLINEGDWVQCAWSFKVLFSHFI